MIDTVVIIMVKQKKELGHNELVLYTDLNKETMDMLLNMGCRICEEPTNKSSIIKTTICW